MAKAITGCMDGGGYGIESVDYKGSIVIEWSAAASKRDGIGRLLPGCLTTVYDEETGKLLPVASITIHAAYRGLITADVAVYLGEHGEILYDVADVAKADAPPATFPFLVAEMRVR